MFACLVLSKELALTVVLNIINNNKGLITVGTHQKVNTFGKLLCKMWKSRLTGYLG